MNETGPVQPRRRGIYLLPNLLTTAALFAGFYGIVASMGGRFEAAAVAIYVAMVMDGLDGRVARLTQTQSEFGVQYDSLSDVVSFGLAPALVIYQWSLEAVGKPGWLAAFLYTACAALRLARFNTQAGKADRRFFQGLASPPAAALVAGLVWVGAQAGWDGHILAPLSFLVTVMAALLMVSNVRYYSFKDVDLKGRVPFMATVAVAVLFAVVFVQPALVLFVLACAYAVSGPVWTVIALRRRRAERRAGHG